MNFNEVGLKNPIVQAVESMGFEQLTPIQEQAIPYILAHDSDLIALAQTGTGKTAAFGLPVLNSVNVSSGETQALVLCPTRELCLQITGDLQNFSKFMEGLEIVPVYGGSSIVNQIKQLKKRCQIVVATPGRAIDLMERKALKLSNINWLVLDEADEMLSMGFKEDLDTILADTPQTKRVLLFSATMPPDIERMAHNYMNQPHEIAVAAKNIAAENVEHQYFMIRSKDRYEALKRIADVNPNIYAIVFCRTRMECKEVADKLIADGYNADALHGDLSQAQRDSVMQRFRIKHLQILVATDVAARGLDVNDLSHVINYNLPDDPEVYVHRSGRTGRAGKSGVSISLIHLREKGRLKDIERLCKRKFVQKSVPTGNEICQIQLTNLIEKVQGVEVDNQQLLPFNSLIEDKFGGIEKDEIVRKFLSLEFNRFLDYYKNAVDINVEDEHVKEQRGKRGREEKNGRRACKFSRLFISIGTRDNLTPKSIMGFINRVVDNRDVVIGHIDIMRNFSFFEVDQAHEKEVVAAMNGAKFDDVPVSVEISESSGKHTKAENGKNSERGSKRGDNRRERKERLRGEERRNGREKNDSPFAKFEKRGRGESRSRKRR